MSSTSAGTKRRVLPPRTGRDRNGVRPSASDEVLLPVSHARELVGFASLPAVVWCLSPHGEVEDSHGI
jgi:hypothetical protein